MENTGENELKTAMLELGKDLLSMGDDSFKQWASSLDKEVAKALLSKHRSNRDFYKKILIEERRVSYPNSYRYEDAERKMKKCNTQGKILKTIVESN